MSQDSPDVSVVIVNWNTRDYLLDVVASGDTAGPTAALERHLARWVAV